MAGFIKLQFELTRSIWGAGGGGVGVEVSQALGKFAFPIFPQVLRQVEEGYRLPKPKTCPQLVYDIMRECW